MRFGIFTKKVWKNLIIEFIQKIFEKRTRVCQKTLFTFFLETIKVRPSCSRASYLPDTSGCPLECQAMSAAKVALARVLQGSIKLAYRTFYLICSCLGNFSKFSGNFDRHKSQKQIGNFCGSKITILFGRKRWFRAAANYWRLLRRICGQVVNTCEIF